MSFVFVEKCHERPNVIIDLLNMFTSNDNLPPILVGTSSQREQTRIFDLIRY